MNYSICCRMKSKASTSVPLESGSRTREAAGLIFPGALLALLPKCPMRLAAYVTLGTGFTLSHTSASFLMRSLTAICLSIMAFCVVRRIMKHQRQKYTFNLKSINTLP